MGPMCTWNITALVVPSSNKMTRTPTDDLLNASYPTNRVKISLGTLLATP
jgi:hypothetical protein